MHGGHPYNENNNDDLKIVNKWKEKSKELSFNGNTKNSYKSAIYVWTISDVKKRQYANEHKLNYIEFWSINDVKQFIESLIKL